MVVYRNPFSASSTRNLAFAAGMGAMNYYSNPSGSRTKQPYIMTNGGSQTRTLINKRRKKRGPYKSFKKLVYDTEPAKHYTFDGSTSTTHNTIYTCSPTQGIVQGTGATARIGDEVYLCALKLHGLAVAATASNAYKYRVLVGWTGEEYSTANIANQFVSGLGAAEIFLPNTAATLTVNGIVNSKAITIIHDETIDINSQISTVADWSSFSYTVPLNMVYPYQASGSVFGKNKNLVVIVTSAVAGGTTGTTSTGSFVISADLIFK